MSRRTRVDYPGAVHHVTCRGDGGQRIVLVRADAEAFVHRLSKVVVDFRWELLAWCLMENHYHLVVRVIQPNLSRGMQRLNTGLSAAFRLRHGSTGHLFEGPFDAAPVESDAHAIVACRYVALNPVVAGLVEAPEQWPWSSYRATVGLDPEPTWLKVEVLLRTLDDDLARARVQFREMVEDHSRESRRGRSGAPMSGRTRSGAGAGRGAERPRGATRPGESGLTSP